MKCQKSGCNGFYQCVRRTQVLNAATKKEGVVCVVSYWRCGNCQREPDAQTKKILDF